MKPKKLVMMSETIRHLQAVQLENIRGGSGSGVNTDEMGRCGEPPIIRR